MRSVSMLGVALVTAGFATTCLAQKPFDEKSIRAAFTQADRNGDGHVDVDEYIAYVIDVFNEYDTSGDQHLVIAELPYSEPARFRSADRDGDGKLSVGEAVAIKMIDYFDIDTNHDGVLSIDEVLVFEQARAKGMGG